jgi:hypothetical protein
MDVGSYVLNGAPAGGIPRAIREGLVDKQHGSNIKDPE